MRSIKWSSVGVNLTVILLVIIWTVPTLGLFITSFRDKEAISNSGWWTVFTNPQGAFTLDNYEKVLFGGDGLATAFLNTLAVTVPAVVIPILIAAFAAYGFAWMQFPGRRILFITVVALLVVPLQIALQGGDPPEARVVRLEPSGGSWTFTSKRPVRKVELNRDRDLLALLKDAE